VVLINGRPASIVKIAEQANAIVEGWYVGEQGGNAVATCFSATSIPAANCRSPFRAAPVNCPLSTR